MARAKMGLLPLYLKLYDDMADGPGRRPRIEEFPRTIAAELGRRGVDVVVAPVCRIEKEFAAAVRKLEAEKVDALVTLHLAYSPSLESAAVLAKSRLPVIVLDTTPTWSFSPAQDPDEVMYNHGIHGVQDLCNLLLRLGKPFLIEAGHWQRSDVLDRVARLASPARMAAAMRRGRVGILGSPFKGMGDFHVPPAKIRSTIGATVLPMDRETLRKLVASVRPKEAEAEVAADAARYERDGASDEAHARSVRLGLAIRRWVEQEQLTALTFNFLNMAEKDGYITAPFLEMSKSMERGLGYAGEGDTLTALLVGALAAGNPDTSFTEMFCPDWEHDTLYLSHMGEVNPRLVEGRPRLREMDYHYSRTGNPAFVVGRLRPGDIVLVNLAPTAAGYRLIVAPARMLGVPGGEDRLEHSVHGWFSPPMPVAEFLAAYSRLGGTHHLAVSYTGDPKPFESFGALMGWDVAVIR
jgi:L-arabinose isomerase